MKRAGKILEIPEKVYLYLYLVRYALLVYFLLQRLGACSFQMILCVVLNTHPNLSPKTAERAVKKVIDLMLKKDIVVTGGKSIKTYKLNEELFNAE